ncbi:hypothetical protein DFH06DRAFT_1482167 [Mycena polygramma]|nr:hypothetical protein DFH06DRAFT_1482167 [Mycena polygramma]
MSTQLTSALSSRLCSLCISFTRLSPAACVLRISMPPPSTLSFCLCPHRADSTHDRRPLQVLDRRRAASALAHASSKTLQLIAPAPARPSALPRLLLSSAMARISPALRTSSINDVDARGRQDYTESYAESCASARATCWRLAGASGTGAGEAQLTCSAWRRARLATRSSLPTPSPSAASSSAALPALALRVSQHTLHAAHSSRPLRLAAMCPRAARSPLPALSAAALVGVAHSRRLPRVRTGPYLPLTPLPSASRASCAAAHRGLALRHASGTGGEAPDSMPAAMRTTRRAALSPARSLSLRTRAADSARASRQRPAAAARRMYLTK